MVQRSLVCSHCGAEFPIGPMLEGCPACDLHPIRASLEVRFDLNEALRDLDKRELEITSGSMWRFMPFLPVADHSNIMSLGEGGTPLLRISRLNDELGVPNLWIKNETQNPTWSFKDRFNSVAISMGREFGYTKIVSSSTGNHGASAAAFAALAGMECIVLTPQETPELAHRQISSYGAQVVVTAWQGRSQLLSYLVREEGWYCSKSSLANPIGNPYGLEGYKTIGYELVLQSREAPLDYVLDSVGGGDQIFGVYKGLREFYELGIAATLPKMVACQAEGASPVVQAFDLGLDRVRPVQNAYSIATSTREEIAGDNALRAIRESEGMGVVVSEKDIIEAMRSLGRVGIAAEAASCIPVAAAKKLVAEEKIPKDAQIACVLTSAGIKWPEQLSLLGRSPWAIAPSVEALQSMMGIS